MSDRFVNKNKEYEVECNDATFVVKHLEWSDRRKLAAIIRRLHAPIIKILGDIDKVKASDLSEEDKEAKIDAIYNEVDETDILTDADSKFMNIIINKYLISIKDCDIAVKDVQLKEVDVLALMNELLVLSQLKEDEAKNSSASSSGE